MVDYLSGRISRRWHKKKTLRFSQSNSLINRKTKEVINMKYKGTRGWEFDNMAQCSASGAYIQWKMRDENCFGSSCVHTVSSSGLPMVFVVPRNRKARRRLAQVTPPFGRSIEVPDEVIEETEEFISTISASLPGDWVLHF